MNLPDVQQVTVTINKPVDTEKAKLALIKGTTDVATTVKFNADKIRKAQF
ncbi:hypothetical protein [Paenibacillus sp. yr247]|nr:hypothetical protein [Paenibacillus sp. yr247]